MQSRPMIARLAGLAASVFMPLVALAEVPPALDRVPADVPVMVSMRSVSGFVTNLEAFTKSMSLPTVATTDFQEIKDLLKTPGVNAEGSAAIAILSVDEAEGGEQPAVAIIPVKDYAAFAKSFGGTGTGVEEIKIKDEAQFIKSLDGGFAALGKNKEIVEKFAGKPGNGAAIEKLLGPNGKLAAEGKDAVIIANLPALAPKIKEGMAEAKENMKAMAEMGGGGEKGAEGNVAMLSWFEEGLTRDGQSGVLAVSMGESGLKLDMAGQFKEGSEWAKYFTGKGKGGALTGALPNEAFLFAFAIDTSSPGLRTFAKQIGEMQKKAGGGGMFGGMNPMAFMDKLDAMGFILGESPAPIGGLFLNTAYYMRTSDAKGLLGETKKMMTELNGKTEGGIKFATTYTEGGEKIGDKAVDVWSMRMSADPNAPEAAGVAQMQAMLFGPNGMQGYMGAVNGGVIATYAKNKDMFTKAAAALESGKGMTEDKGIAEVGGGLPKDRSMEGYIGVKSILNVVSSFMGMMGGPANFEVPEDLRPIGFGGTTDQGGVRVAVNVPAQVLKTFADLQKQMQGGGEEEPAGEPMDEKGAGQPKF